MNPRQIALIFWNRRNTIILVFAVSVLAALVVGWSLKPRYTATAQLFINLADPNGATNAVVQPAVVRNYMLTQIEAARSRGVALTVVDHEKLAEKPVWQAAFAEAGGTGDVRDWIASQIQGGLTVMRQAASDIIALSYQSGDPVSAARYANAFADAHVQRELELRAGPAKSLSRWYDDRLKELRERYSAVETQRSQLRLDAIRRGETDAAGAVDPLMSLPTIYATARGAVIQARAALEAAKIGQNLASENPELVALRRQASDLDLSLKRETQLLGAQHRRIVALRANLEQTNSQIEAALNRLRAELVAEKTRELAAAEQRMADAGAQIGRDENQRNEQILNRASASSLDRELEALRTQIDTMVQRREKAMVEGASNMGNVSVLSEAAVPQQPSWPRMPLLLAVAGGLGISFGLALAFLREMMDRRVRCTDDLTGYCNAPLLGVVPGRTLTSSMARVPAKEGRGIARGGAQRFFPSRSA
jgi:succinoglycan biosynthesis transport protein ExoP